MHLDKIDKYKEFKFFDNCKVNSLKEFPMKIIVYLFP